MIAPRNKYRIEPINHKPGRKILTALDVEEEYTPQGTKTLLKVEDMDVNELKMGQIRPWDLCVAAALTRPYVTIETAIQCADEMLKARRERYPQDD